MYDLDQKVHSYIRHMANTTTPNRLRYCKMKGPRLRRAIPDHGWNVHDFRSHKVCDPRQNLQPCAIYDKRGRTLLTA